MENHFYHIKLPPLNFTIFITHVRNLCNGYYTNVVAQVIAHFISFFLIINFPMQAKCCGVRLRNLIFLYNEYSQLMSTLLLRKVTI